MSPNYHATRCRARKTAACNRGDLPFQDGPHNSTTILSRHFEPTRFLHIHSVSVHLAGGTARSAQGEYDKVCNAIGIRRLALLCGSPANRSMTILSEESMNIIKATKQFLKEEDGVTALEYGLLAAVVAGALVVVAGPALRTFFTDLFAKLGEVISEAFP